MLRAIVLALAISVDGLGVGLVYGLRRITIPAVSLFFIGLMSAAAVTAAMFAGNRAAACLNPTAARYAGGSLILLLGVWLLLQAWSERLRAAAGEVKKRSVVSIRIRSLGLIVQILSEPAAADVDNSGHISLPEAVALGAALAMDAVGAGVGAALSGYLPLLSPLLVGAGAVGFICGGGWLGRRYGERFLHTRAAFVPGVLLVLLGLSALL